MAALTQSVHRDRPRACRPGTLVITDATTGTAHLVTEDDVRAGRRTGQYRAVCTTLVLAASLLTPARHSCTDCVRGRAAR